MRKLVHTSQFKRDYKKLQRDKVLTGLVAVVVDNLLSGKALPAKFRDHPLKGGYADCRECHIRPDLLLIYARVPDELRLIRLGSHAELFA